MTKTVLCALGVFFITISLYAVHHPTGDLASFMSISGHWNNVRIGLGIALLVYSLIDPVRQAAVRLLAGLAASVAIGLTIMSFFTVYILAIDTFCLLTGSIFVLLASLELPTNHPVHIESLHLPHLPRLQLPLAKLSLHLPHLHLSHRAWDTSAAADALDVPLSRRQSVA